MAAIIDGTGSIGAAIGPLLTGYIADSDGSGGWDNVFFMLYASAAAAALCVLRLVIKEWRPLTEALHDGGPIGGLGGGAGAGSGRSGAGSLSTGRTSAALSHLREGSDDIRVSLLSRPPSVD